MRPRSLYVFWGTSPPASKGALKLMMSKMGCDAGTGVVPLISLIVNPFDASCPAVTVPEDGNAPVPNLEKNDAEFAGNIAAKVGSITSSVSVAALRTRVHSVLS